METITDDYLFMIEQATKAPSGHNTQPWLFRIVEAGIEIHPDKTKTLSIVDGNQREMFISLGCATENLCLAAQTKGYSAQVNIADNGNITVKLQPNAGVITPSSIIIQVGKQFLQLRIHRKIPCQQPGRRSREKGKTDGGS